MKAKSVDLFGEEDGDLFGDESQTQPSKVSEEKPKKKVFIPACALCVCVCLGGGGAGGGGAVEGCICLNQEFKVFPFLGKKLVL